MSSYTIPKTIKDLKISRERANFVSKLLADINKGESLDSNDANLLFNFYSQQSRFTPESLHALLIEQLLFNKLIPVLPFSVSSSLFSQHFKSAYALDLATFSEVTRTLDFKALSFEVSPENPSTFSSNYHTLHAQIYMDEDYLSKTEESSFQTTLLEEFKLIGLSPERMAVSKNFSLSMLECLVIFAQPIGYLTFPPTFMMEKDGKTFVVNCTLYFGGLVPSSKKIFEEMAFFSLEGGQQILKNAGEAISNSASSLNERLRVKETVLGGYEKIKDSGFVRKTGESLGYFFTSVKNTFAGGNSEGDKEEKGNGGEDLGEKEFE